ncbi:QcrA and Rieske domain-containing protein [Mycolicibacterium arseniciresistens]|uniref:Cytochrome bc1 complex Rieske iron-sulfur subunit n=1 Tax=Mycolicibacterium arseniciresistens TaxID=3062257 RepID=A0ABT8UKX5_9MYCO|nr:Rieske (2Fe-2S) protein [Mycolicibacterium arseniciresistens]MDO3638454.1 Rieske (2Fe-2S) protein [Mycolicibacterium arseniciresistens]
MFLHDILLSRQKLIAAAGLGAAATVLSACATYGKEPTPGGAPAPNPEPDAPGAPPTVQGIANTADIPVGSGLIVDGVVVTQPSEGVFAGFSAVCTHAGCTVSEVVDGTIVCPCHGSRFNLDGSVANGPASRPLDTRAVSVRGDSIVLG